MPETPYFVTLPLDDIIGLRGLVTEFPKLANDVTRLRAEINGVRCVQSQIMVKLSDIGRGVSPGTEAHYDKASAVSCVKGNINGKR